MTKRLVLIFPLRFMLLNDYDADFKKKKKKKRNYIVIFLYALLILTSVKGNWQGRLMAKEVFLLLPPLQCTGVGRRDGIYALQLYV